MRERETIETDVLLIGAGPASLACAVHLGKLFAAAGERRTITVLEKGREVGEHILSGAVMDPRALDELFAGRWLEEGCPVEGPVSREAVYYLTARRRLRFPFLPPPLKNHGAYVVTLSHVVRWLKEKAEEAGADVFEGFPAADILRDGARVAGARTVDLGVRRDGTPREGFTPGTDVRAQVTIFGEGSRGSLARRLIEEGGLEGRNPQVYATGIKELWELAPGRLEPGEVIHTAGWPLARGHYGGGWIYGLAANRASIGFVPALDYRHPRFNPWDAAQRWKTHPWLRGLLDGGKLLKAGAKTVPEGGFWSQPRLYGDGFLLIGDAASFLNAPRLKGIHTAVKSGMLAAETVFEALEEGRFDAAMLSGYERRYRESWLWDELRRVRNMRQAFTKSFFAGALHAGALYLAGGRLLKDPLPLRPDPEHMAMARDASPRDAPPPLEPDGVLTFDRLTGVFHAGARHEEDQPSHLLVAEPDLCATRCREEYGNPCEHFCPAQVYEIVDAAGSPEGKRLQINQSNCVHCKTCDIMDPYGVIRWTVPHDAGGPSYLGL